MAVMHILYGGCLILMGGNESRHEAGWLWSLVGASRDGSRLLSENGLAGEGILLAETTPR